MNARNFFSVLFLSISVFTKAQNIVFVSPDGRGDGKSWKTAAGDLQLALKSAIGGTEIWVAEGIYRPTEGRDRNESFMVKEGVKLFGGFAGNEKNLAERKAELHPTVLSGNIGHEDADDNSFNVVTMDNTSAATVLDGFIVNGGNANGNGQSGERNRSGGGLHISASHSASPTIRNCVFIDNFAKDGGAVYVNARNGGVAAPTFKNCNFETNTADLDGGAVNLDGRSKGQNNAVFTACNFSNNKGNYGGAIFCYALNGECIPTVTNSMMSANSAYVKGGAIFQLTTDALGKMDTGKIAFSNNTALDHDTDDFTQYSVSTNEFASK